MKKYKVYFIFLILATGLIIFGACGSGEIIDISSNMKLADDINNAEDVLVGSLIKECKEASAAADTTNLKCKKFTEERSSSSSKEPSSSSQKEDASCSSRDNRSSSSKAEASSSSSVVVPPGSYDVPQFTCVWVPNSVEPGGKAQLKVEFRSSTAALERDCEKTAWLGISKVNDFGTPTGVYDTSYFVLNRDITVSGSVLNSKVQWPSSGEFKSDPSDPRNPAAKLVKGMITCENVSQNKARYARSEDCEPLQIGYKPSSSSLAPSSSSSSLSSSSLAPSSSSSRSSSSSLAPSSSSRSSSSLAPSSSSSSSRSSSSSVAPPPPPPPSSSSNSSGNGTCGPETAIAVKQSVSVGDCMKQECSGSSNLRIAFWQGSDVLSVNLTGGCIENNKTITKGAGNNVSVCNAPGSMVYIEIKSGSSTDFQTGCWP